MRGRKPIPTEIHAFRGTLRKARHLKRALEPRASGDLSEAPVHFTPAQRETWPRVVREAPTGVLRACDREILILFVEAADRHQRAMIAQAKMDQGSEHPLLVQGSAGTLMPSPYLRILNQSAELMLRCATEMGLTPASRPRLAGVATKPTPPAPDSAWAKLRLLQGRINNPDDEPPPQAA